MYVEFLQDHAKKEGRTFTEILCQAINSEEFIAKIENEGLQLLLKDGDELRYVVRSPCKG